MLRMARACRRCGDRGRAIVWIQTRPGSRGMAAACGESAVRPRSKQHKLRLRQLSIISGRLECRPALQSLASACRTTRSCASWPSGVLFTASAQSEHSRARRRGYLCRLQDGKLLMSRQKAVRLYRRTAFCLPLSSTGRRHMYTFYCEWKTKKVHAEMYSLRTGALAPREPDTVFRAAGGATGPQPVQASGSTV